MHAIVGLAGSTSLNAENPSFCNGIFYKKEEKEKSKKPGERLTCRGEMCIMKSYGITMNKVRLRDAGQEDI